MRICDVNQAAGASGWPLNNITQKQTWDRHPAVKSAQPLFAVEAAETICLQAGSQFCSARRLPEAPDASRLGGITRFANTGLASVGSIVGVHGLLDETPADFRRGTPTFFVPTVQIALRSSAE